MAFARPRLPLNFSLMSTTRRWASVRTIEEAFVNSDVQHLLRLIASSSTVAKPDVVFAPQKIKRSRSKITLMTREEYDEKLKSAVKIAQSRMQPFPVKIPRSDHPAPGTMLQSDADLAGLCSHRHVFVDLSPTGAGKRNLVVVREPQGDLRSATLEERSRFTNMFFPQKQPGRLMKTPAMFLDDDQHLRLLLERGQYGYILKRACIQFDPDDSEFIKITNVVFDHLASRRRFESLDATPFFGNLIFHCVFSIDSNNPGSQQDNSQRLCNLLSYLISLDRSVDATRVLRLCEVIHPQVFKISFSPNADNDSSSAQSALVEVLPRIKHAFSAEQFSELSLTLQASIDRAKAEKVSATA